MGAGHGHGHAGARHRWRLAVAFGLVATFFGVELAVGLATGSLALISDAGHMAADVVALGAALVATKIATRPDGTGRRTYGSYRAEVFASGLTVLIMRGVSVYVVVEALNRIGETVELSSGPLLVVGAIGLVVNLVCLVLLTLISYICFFDASGSRIFEPHLHQDNSFIWAEANRLRELVGPLARHLFMLMGVAILFLVFPTHWVVFLGFLTYALSGPAMALWRRLRREPAAAPSEGREPPSL